MNQQETTIMGATTVNLLTFDNCIISHKINILVLVGTGDVYNDYVIMYLK